jgi:hypothetical protein
VLMDAQPVQYVKTSDGYNIAITVSGSGQPLILFPILLVDIHALWRQALQAAARAFRTFSGHYVRLQRRGDVHPWTPGRHHHR